MANENNITWFKFSPASWMMGRIQRQSDSAQVGFLRICCKYWHNQCKLSEEEAILESNDDDFRQLLSAKLIDSDGNFIAIDFLDEQWSSIEYHLKKSSEGGRKSAEKRLQKTPKKSPKNTVKNAPKKEVKNTEKTAKKHGSTPLQPPFNPPSTPLQPPFKDSSTEKKREEKKRRKGADAPALPSVFDVIEFFVENGYDEKLARKAFKFYDDSDWKDSHGNAVKNWQKKMVDIWFKDDGKIIDKKWLNFYGPAN